jgi:broad specificity phosphatase PhoE
MSLARYSTAIWLALATLLPLNEGSSASAQSGAPATRPGTDLVQALRQGGYVIYFRHAASDQTASDRDRANLDQCEMQRNLTDEGRRQAREIGNAFRTLGIPVGTVLASPFCRCRDTANLAFGQSERSDTLYYSIGVDPAQRARRNADLRSLLGTAPAPGTNTILVSHHANLKEATGAWPKQEGMAEIFRRSPGLELEHIAEVPVEAWSQWARVSAINR